MDDMLVVETPERVELHFPLAAPGNRFLACAIDHTIQLVVLLIVLLAGDYLDTLPASFGQGDLVSLHQVSLWFKALGILFVFILFFGYFVIFETIWNGQTPGKRWMRLRVIQEDGRPVTFFSALSRNVIRLADMVVPPFYSVGLVVAVASRYSKRLGDFVAHTVVVREWPEVVFSPEQLAPPSQDAIDSESQSGWGFEGEIELISPAELLVVEVCLRRTQSLPPASREWLAWRVATPLMEKIRPVFEREGFTYEGFLRQLMFRTSRKRTGADPASTTPQSSLHRTSLHRTSLHRGSDPDRRHPAADPGAGA